MTSPKKSKEELQLELLKLLEAKETELRYNKRDTRFPETGPYRRSLYPKHIEFMNKGGQHPERAFIAGNRTGKTETAGYEMQCHLTGDYPSWWEGRKFADAVSAWCVSITNQQQVEATQKVLLGDVNDIGSGLIPKHKIVRTTRKPGVPGAIEHVYVKHTSGKDSVLTFKTYDQGREAFQGSKKQVIWMDEEERGAISIYSECLTRLMDKFNPGIIFCTFTPIGGLSDVLLSFMPDGLMPYNGINPKLPHKFATKVSWDDVPHMGEEEKLRIAASYSPHERAARMRGEPHLGSGAIYPFETDTITVSPFLIPEYWPQAFGLDVGWNRTAAVWGAMDPQSKIVYLYSEHYVEHATPADHASALKSRGDWIPGVIDPASQGSSQADGRAIIDLYMAEGLDLVVANNATEAGIQKVYQMFMSGQLKIFSTLFNTLQELRIYRRDETGKIVKKNDHLMDAIRYLILSGLIIMREQPDPDAIEKNKNQNIKRDEFTGY